MVSGESVFVSSPDHSQASPRSSTINGCPKSGAKEPRCCYCVLPNVLWRKDTKTGAACVHLGTLCIRDPGPKKLANGSFRNERDICREVCKPKNRHESPVRLSPTILLPNNRENVNLFQSKFARLSFPGKSFQWTHSAPAMHYKVRNLKLLHKVKPYHQCQFKHTGLVCHAYSDMGRTNSPPQKCVSKIQETPQGICIFQWVSKEMRSYA